MTEIDKHLIELQQRHDERDFLRAVTKAILSTLMEPDVESMISVGRYERGRRSPAPLARRLASRAAPDRQLRASWRGAPRSAGMKKPAEPKTGAFI